MANPATPLAAGAPQMAGMAGMAAPSGAGPDAAQHALQQAVSQVRQLSQLAQQVGDTTPVLQPEMQQIKQIIMRAVTKLGNAAPKQTPSSQAVPGGG